MPGPTILASLPKRVVGAAAFFSSEWVLVMGEFPLLFLWMEQWVIQA